MTKVTCGAKDLLPFPVKLARQRMRMRQNKTEDKTLERKDDQSWSEQAHTEIPNYLQLWKTKKPA